MFGTQHFSEPVRTVDNSYHAVVLGSIVPTRGQRFSVPFLSEYRGVIDPVSGQYLGIPLVLMLVLFCVWFRRNRVFMFVVSLAIVSFVLSQGLHLSWLHLAGSLPLPGAVIAHVPWLNNLLPERLTLYVALFVAIAVGLGLSNLRTTSLPGSGVRYRPRVGLTVRYRNVGVVILGAVTVVTLLPNWPYRSAPSNVPYFFRSALVRQVPFGGAVLTYPFPQYPRIKQ